MIHKKKAYSDKYMEIKPEILPSENTWYKVEMISLDDETKNISATKIRNELKNETT